ncbi:hypothetical protein [Streptomyces sp. NPDC002346]
MDLKDAGCRAQFLIRDRDSRGLFLIAQLSQRWGSRYTRHGKTIWTEQPLPTPGP